MNITIMVRPGSSQQSIEKSAPDRFLVRMVSRPEHHEANRELLKILSKYFSVPVSHIKIKHGLHDKVKLVEVT